MFFTPSGSLSSFCSKCGTRYERLLGGLGCEEARHPDSVHPTLKKPRVGHPHFHFGNREPEGCATRRAGNVTQAALSTCVHNGRVVRTIGVPHPLWCSKGGMQAIYSDICAVIAEMTSFVSCFRCGRICNGRSIRGQ